jgi:hypothetical protein
MPSQGGRPGIHFANVIDHVALQPRLQLQYVLCLTPLEHMSMPLSLDEEARLYTTNAEREKYESLATLYGIVVALDYLERAYVRDSVTAAECVVVLRLWLKH